MMNIEIAFNPFQELFNDYSLDETYNELFQTAFPVWQEDSVQHVKATILKAAFAVLCAHVIKEANDEVAYTDLDELIDSAGLHNHKSQYLYLLGAEGIAWQEDDEFDSDPFAAMLKELMVKYVEWWANYLRSELTPEERMALLSKFPGVPNIKGSPQFMRALKFRVQSIF